MNLSISWPLWLLCVLLSAGCVSADTIEQPLTLPDGSRYSGELREGLLSGEGRLEWPNGDAYEGEFANGMMHGKGTLSMATGDIYQGDFIAGRFTGEGSDTGSDGTEYQGEFVDYDFTGEGQLTTADGDIYIGDFTAGVLDGQGTFTGTDGSYYAGEFVDGAYEGYGIWHNDQWRYTGEFAMGYFDGFGERVDVASGEVMESGEWQFGQFVGEREPVNKAERRRQQLAIENALFNQPERLRETLNTLAPSEPGQVDLFALIGAGDGTQKVFSLESQTIAGFLQHELVAPGHLITLSNFPGTMDSEPLLTLSNLQQAVQALAERMQPEDVLLLYLTSHGSAEHEFALDAPGHRFVGITPQDLVDALTPLADNPKVLMVSACYSGGFIEALKAPQHLVMTAARADRTSFGCGDADTMTYFGRAYFEKALPDSASFIEAFSAAQKYIETWEDEQDVEHSEPQIFVGAEVEAALNTLGKSPATDHAH
ncbi:C13 family peptidase [Gilvimarinus agarilyticus]|uniref:C13 family peptidase n=1 Tax=Gilvimarinus agarilyticus TaxID=679259 RepID=UPI000696E15D|nr:C13 family peptidase [Gilvimarinus agarilyticus]